MGVRGPSPRLEELRRLEGFPDKKPPKPARPMATGVASVPTHVDDDARQCLEQIQSSMPPTVFAACDTCLLTAFAVAWSLHKRAVIEIGKPNFPFIISTGATKKPNPWLNVLNQQASMMASLGDRLGLSPTARARLQVPDEKAPSKFAGLGGRELDA